MDKDLITLLCIAIPTLLAVFALRYVDRHVERSQKAEKATWRAFQQNEAREKAAQGRRWAQEDFQRWQMGQKRPLLALGTSQGVRLAYYRELNRLMAQQTRREAAGESWQLSQPAELEQV